MPPRELTTTASAAGPAAPARDRVPRIETPAAVAVLGVLFTLTGATALLAEQAFEKLLSTLVGASTPAAATVLAVYFGGLTLGGLLYGALPVLRRANPLRVYAVLEASVAFWALLLWLAFDRLIPIFAPLLATAVDQFWPTQAARALVAACWILPATVPMGASFPAIVDALGRLGPSAGGRAISRFYTLNLTGAVIGAVAGPFLFFPLWGVGGALLLTFFVDLTACLGALALARRMTPRAADSTRPADRPAVASVPLPGSRLLLALAAGSGFLFFSLEVVWTHLIGAVLGNSVYAFAAMLAAVLIGLGIGGALTTYRFRKTPHIPIVELGSLLFAGAIVLAISSSQWPAVPDSLALLAHSARSFGHAELIRWTLAMILIAPPAALLGAVYPTLFRLDIFPSHDSGPAVGRIVAANALGCIAGALFTGFGLIPRFGSESTFLFLICLIVALGFAVSWRLWRDRAGRRAMVIGAAALLLVAVLPRWDRLRLTSGKHVYFQSHEVFPESKLRFFHEDTLGGITTVVDNPAGIHAQPRPYRTLLTNGKFQGNDSWEMDAQTGFALVPMLFAPKHDDALVIGLGTGRTARIVEAMGFGSVDVAEIAPGIVDGATRFFPHINGSVLGKPNVKLILEDGRNSLLLHPKKYDLITIEISSVWFAGATNLFSREFYALVRSRLKPGGVFQQWLQLHHIGESEIETVLVSLKSELSEVSFWVVGGQGLLVASDRPQAVQPAFFDGLSRNAERIGWKRDDLATKVRELVASRLLAPEDVAQLAARGTAIPNTDRNRRLEYYTPRYNQVVTDMRRANLYALAGLASFPPIAVEASAAGPLADACRGISREDYLESLGLRTGPRGPAAARSID